MSFWLIAIFGKSLFLMCMYIPNLFINKSYLILVISNCSLYFKNISRIASSIKNISLYFKNMQLFSTQLLIFSNDMYVVCELSSILKPSTLYT